MISAHTSRQILINTEQSIYQFLKAC